MDPNPEYLPEVSIVAIHCHLRKYYSRYIRIYNLSIGDMVQDVYLRLLEGTSKNINSACASVARVEIRYRKRYILTNVIK
jgi:hypothetical protein